jgi:iron complex outermembrane receptor protein
VLSLTVIANAVACAADLSPETLADFSLEDLSNIAITSVSGRAERLSGAPASIFVITNDDIRRSGVTSLPEALRLAPNLEVARMSANSYAISARGMNNADNKLLVLIDGRIVYTPLYSGVLWDAQDVLLQDVERIEVISGPGGTLWGSNAVNGVINVITRGASSTQGSLVAVGGGNQERDFAARYGGKLGDDVFFRLYAKGFHDDSTERTDGSSAQDAWKRAQIGFRVDWRSELTVQGDAYKGVVDQANAGQQHISGANVLARWTHALSGGDSVLAQAYIDQTQLEVPGAPGIGTLAERLNIYDVELQYNMKRIDAHTVTWGAGYRLARDHLNNSPVIAFLPDQRNLTWADVFIQDVIALKDDLNLTAGVRGEHNSYTGFEVLPSVRLSWKLDPQNLVWGGVSRAVRTPSRLDRDLYSPAQPPFVIAGGPQFRSETSDVFELGIRAQPTATLSYSITAFHHIYNHLRSVELIDGSYLSVANQMEGNASGVEAWANWQVTGSWRLSAGGMVLDQNLKLRPDSTDPTGISAAGNDPDNQWTLRSSMDLPHDTSLDLAIRHVAALPDPVVPAYTAFDARLAWRPRPDLELSLTGQNLFGTEHVEFGPAASASVIPRSIFFNVLWRV